MTTASSRNWMGRTPEMRVSERRQRLIDAAIELLGTRGASALTLRAVCGEAGLSPKFFYESFADQDELIVAAYDTTVARLVAEFENVDLSHADPPRELVRMRLATTYGYLRKDPRAARILFREPFAVDALRVRAQSTVPAFMKMMLDPNGNQSLTSFHGAALGGALVGVFIDQIESGLVEDDETFVDNCTDVIMRILAPGPLGASH